MKVLFSFSMVVISSLYLVDSDENNIDRQFRHRRQPQRVVNFE